MQSQEELIEAYFTNQPEWQVLLLNRLRQLVHRAHPEIQETFKWRTPQFEHRGLLIGLAAFKKHIVMHFHRGAELEDKAGLFYASEAKGMRGIRFEEGDEIRATAIEDLVQQAVRLNQN